MLITWLIGSAACRSMGVVRHMELLVSVARQDTSDAVLGGMARLSRKVIHNSMEAEMGTAWDLAPVATLDMDPSLQTGITTTETWTTILNSPSVMGGEDIGQAMAVEATVEEVIEMCGLFGTVSHKG
jgi:hypothetical protein